MNKKRVMLILGTRPEAIKLAPVIEELKISQDMLPVVCTTGQHRGMLDQVLDWFAIKPDYDLGLMQKDQGLAEFAARALTRVRDVLALVKPERVLIQGDTTTAMIGALAAFYSRIPVGHVEAGLRTRNLYEPFPEEMNRRVASVVADYHFAPTEHAANALRLEQVDPVKVFVVGNTVIDALRITLGRQEGVAPSYQAAKGRRLIVVTAHRRESFGRPFESICRAIRKIADRNPDVEIIYPVHPNPNVRGPVRQHLSGHPRINLVEPLRYEQFVYLLAGCFLILTDSGGIQEEATALAKPTLVMRNNTERPEAMSSGTTVLVGTDDERIVGVTERLLRDHHEYQSMSNSKSPFGDGHAAEKIVSVLRSSFNSGRSSAADQSRVTAPIGLPAVDRLN